MSNIVNTRTSIRQWQTQERPREKLLNFGAASLSDAELLAIFLRTGVAEQNAVELARELLRDSGGLLSLLGAERQDFCSRKGLGLAKYVQLQAVLETSRRCLQEKMQRQNVLGSPQATRDFLRLKLAPSQHEIFACLYLDSQNQLLRYEELSSGTLDGPSVPKLALSKWKRGR